MIKQWIFIVGSTLLPGLMACSTAPPSAASNLKPTHCEQLARHIERAKDMDCAALYGYSWFSVAPAVRYVRNRPAIYSEIRRIDRMESEFRRDCLSPSTH